MGGGIGDMPFPDIIHHWDLKERGDATEDLYFVHKQTGAEVTLTKGGGVKSELVDTDQANIDSLEPVLKVGFITDHHWGDYGSKGLSSSESELKSKHDEFVTEMNNWGADYVITGGDQTTGDIHSAQTDAQTAISDCLLSLTDGLDAPLYPMWGNHEWYNAATWGSDWSYAPYESNTALSTVATIDDTYYKIETPAVDILVVNSAASPNNDGRSNMRMPRGCIDFIESELETDKDLIIFSHVPISMGTGERYDQIYPGDNTDRSFNRQLARTLGEHENMLAVLSGHSHYEQSEYPNGSFDRTRATIRNGFVQLYQHFPHQLDGDKSITPFGKLYVFPDGKVAYEESYAGDGTGKQAWWTFDGRASHAHEVSQLNRHRSRDFHFETHFPSLDSLYTTGTGTLSYGGNKEYVHLETGGALGDTFKSVFQRSFGRMEGWADRDNFCSASFRVGINVPDTTSVRAWVLWGPEPAGSTGDNVGFFFQDGTLYAQVTRGGTKYQQGMGVNRNLNEKHQLEARILPDHGRVDFYAGGYRYETIPHLPEPNSGDVQTLATMRIHADEAVAKQLDVSHVEIHAAPHLDDHH